MIVEEIVLYREGKPQTPSPLNFTAHVDFP